MSDSFDARILRSLVREAAAEEGKTPDWDSLEDRLFARLDEAPTALSRAMDRADDDDHDDDANTAVRLSELPGEERVSPDPLPSVAVVARHHDAVVHMPGAQTLGAASAHDRVEDDVARSTEARSTEARYAEARAAEAREADDRRSSAAIESYHSPSLMLEPRPRGAAPMTRRVLGVVGALAVAACLALLIGGVLRRSDSGASGSSNSVSIQEERWVDASDVPLAAGLENVHDAGALRRGDVVEATQGAVAFGLKDQLMWTLAPGSRVRIESTDMPGGNHVVVLQSGSLRASVAGSARVNPLVVQAGDAMVRVEGTALPALFTVTRSSKGLAVEMEQGTTLVSALNASGSYSGVGGDVHRLGSRERAFVSLDAREFKLLEPVAISEPVRTSVTADGLVPSTVDARRPDAPVAPAPTLGEKRVDTAPASTVVGAPSALRSSSAGSAEPPPPAAPTPSEAVLSEASVRTSVASCIDAVMNKQASQGGVSVSAESTVRFVVDEDGVIRSASFNPPLKPELQACAAPLLRSKVSGGARSIQFPVSVVAR